MNDYPAICPYRRGNYDPMADPYAFFDFPSNKKVFHPCEVVCSHGMWCIIWSGRLMDRPQQSEEAAKKRARELNLRLSAHSDVCSLK